MSTLDSTAQGVSPGISQAATLLDRARLLAQTGRYLDLQPLLPALQSDGSVEAMTLAARAMGHLGARRDSCAQALKLWRAHRSHGEAMTEMLRTVAHRRNAYRAWKLMHTLRFPATASDAMAADWYSLCAHILGSVRDFEQAESFFAKALERAPQDPWIQVEWAYVCEQRDRYDDAVAHAEKSLQLLPGYRAGVQALSHFYSLVGREDEALAMLVRASEEMQSTSICTQLLDLQIEHNAYEQAQNTLAMAERFSPLAEKSLTAWFAARRADIALALGRHDDARASALEVGGTYYERLAARLAAGATPARRVELPVGFVRQHHQTCAPATLATLSRYWGREDAEHLEIAEQICYDGTPNHSERRWAEEQGFAALEFTVDWDTATALLDAGVPFTLTTVYTASAHLQAVIGYDALRRTLLIRDPSKRTFNEFEADALFEAHRSTGPRGMLLLPRERVDRIAGIALPDAALWDGYHQVMHALSRHQRHDAEKALQQMQAQQAAHRLTLQAQRAMMAYDGDRQGEFTLTEELLLQFPDDMNLKLAKAYLLCIVGSRAQQETWWQQFATAPHADPVAVARYADFLAEDGREHATAQRLYARALTLNPVHAASWSGLASLTWQHGERKMAQQLFHVAACLGETQEHFAEGYFRACRFLGETDDGIAFLQQRVDVLGTRSAAPVITLFDQLDGVDRTTEAFALLSEALQRRPDDADLLLFAAESQMRYGRHAEALALLGRAEPSANRVRWLRHKARWLRENGEPVQALALAREACALEPLDVGLHSLVASLLSQCEGRALALAHLRHAAQAHPHHQELQRVFVGWLGIDEHDEAIQVLSHMLAVNPKHAWAQRELAYKLTQQQRFDEAWACAETALTLAPHQTTTHSTLADVCLRQGRLEEAREHLRRAIVLSVDNDYAIQALVNLETSLDGRRSALAFVQGELLRQVTLGDGLLTFQETAQHVLEPAELRTMLEDMLSARGDLWQAWTALSVQMIREGAFREANELLDRAIDRFPLLPRFHLEKARAQALLDDREAARASLDLALQISPAWQRAVRLYVDTVMDEGHGFERALSVLDKALHRLPEDAELHALRGWVHRRMANNGAALAELREALQLDPSMRWAWSLFDEISREGGDPQAARQLSEHLTEKHPGNVSAWLRRADHAADTEQALAAADRALALEPRNEAAFAARLHILYQAARHDQLQAMLEGAPWPEGLPAGIAIYKARLARAQGRHDDATDMVRALLERDGNNHALWQELADWSDEKDMHDSYVNAAENMVRLAPNHAVSHGYLGHAHQKAQRLDDAVRHFTRAVALDPAYAFAGVRLADLQLDARQWEAARATLHTLRLHHPTPSVALRELRLAAGQEDEASAALKLAEVVRMRTVVDALAEEALKHIEAAGWEAMALRVIQQTIAKGPCARPAVGYWIDRQGKGWRLPGAFYRDIRRGLAQDPSHSLKSDFLALLGRMKEGQLMRRFVAEYKNVLRADLECWGMVGYVYLSLDQPLKVVHWMSDWRSRPDAPAWALDNLALAYRRVGRDNEAREVTDQSLKEDPSNPDARTWVAMDATLAGQFDDAASLLSGIDTSSVRDYYRHLLTTLQAYLDAVQAGDSRVALGRFAMLRGEAKDHAVLKRLRRTLSARLLASHTPTWLRPWRWLQFVSGMA
jgi:tetratricopeptide (TPR) repeat protein